MAAMTGADVEAAARRFTAERDRSQTTLISAAHPGMDMDDAYAVQADFVRRKLAAGGTIRGWKIGLTSKAMQYALNIDIPDSGVLFEDMFFANGGNGSRRSIHRAADRGGDRLHHETRPFRCECDRRGCYRRDRSCGAGAGNSRHAHFPGRSRHRRARTVLDTISDNAANAGIVLGDAKHGIEDVDLRWVGAVARAMTRSRKPASAQAFSMIRC